MAIHVLHQSLNHGVVDAENLHRTDIDKVRLVAEQQTNILSTAVGPGYLRPGTEYLSGSKSNLECKLEDFVAGEEDGFLLEFTNLVMRVRDPGTDELVTRPAVTSTVTNGDFSSGVGWTLASTDGQSSQVVTNRLELRARAHGGKASAKRQVTTSSPNVEHALRIVVTRGPVDFRCGSTEGGEEYISATGAEALKTGEHSLAFTPTGSYWVQFSTISQTTKMVDSITIESAGVMELPTIWPIEAATTKLRKVQSLDVSFWACDGYKPQRIERRGDTSWSVVDYNSDDGPFLVMNMGSVSLTPAATEGNTTLTASESFFTSNMVGQLIRISHDKQLVETYLAAAGEHTPAILVSGVNETDYNDRKFSVAISGTWVGTIRTQRAFDDEDGDYNDFRRAQTVSTVDIAANASYDNDDNEDNALTWYRYNMAAYTSGEAAISISYTGGGGSGICRITSITNATTAEVEVLVPFKGKIASRDWEEGAWSAKNGYPHAVALADGRLWWFGRDREWGSVSDAYESFDDNVVGEAGPINRSIALGGRNNANWAVGTETLIVGCDSRIVNVSASALQEVITPDNFKNKSISKSGAADLSPVEVSDDRVLYVESSGTTIYEVNWSNEKGNYIASEFSKLTRNPYATGIRELRVQNRPDQRIWVCNENADAVCIVFEPLHEVVAHIPISTKDTGAMTDIIESIAVLPGTEQDRVYMSIKRTVDGSVLRYIEKMALDSEARPGALAKCVDSFVTFGTDQVIDAPHLIGRTVVAWVDGAPVLEDDEETIKEFVVNASGQITLPVRPETSAIVGLPYLGRYKSARLAYGVENATPMLQNKSITAVGLILANYVRSGIKWGFEFDNVSHPLQNLPRNKGSTTAPAIVIGQDSDEQLNPGGGKIGFDERLCIELRSPNPATISAIVLGVETYGR